MLVDAGDKKPAKPIELPDWGEFVLRSSITIPSTWSVEVANDTHTTNPFGSFDSVYSMKDSTLIVERRLTLEEPKVQPDRWNEYAKLSKAVNDDAGHWIQLSTGSGKSGAVVSQNNPEAQRLLQQALEALQRRGFNEARDALDQAERLNPQQAGLWATRAILYGATNDTVNGIASLKKEVQFHPEEVAAWRALGEAEMSLHDTAGAISAFRELLRVAPGDMSGTLLLATLLNNEKRYRETIDLLRPALDGASADAARAYRDTLSDALLRNGQKEEGIAMTKSFADSSDDPNVLNDAAWHLADTGIDIALAIEYSQKGVTKLEETLSSVKLSGLTNEDLQHIAFTTAIWDTLGWSFFQAGDLAKAEKYLAAAWSLAQQGPVADHLGQIYEKQGRKDDARHFYELARAAGGVGEDTTERLDHLGGPVNPMPRPTLRRGPVTQMKPADPNWIDPGEELGKLRTTGVPLLNAQKGTAEFFLSFSKSGVEETLFISGDQSLKDAGGVLSKTAFKVPFPDDGPERIVRRGILSCSAVTKPSCQIVFLLPANTAAN